jgi:hypothetical protein
MPLLIKKRSPNFWRDSLQRRRRGSNQGPLGPSNLKANVLLTELQCRLKYLGQIQTKYYKYYVYIIRDGLKGSFLRKQALNMYNNITEIFLFFYFVTHISYLSSNIVNNKGE